MRRRTVVHWARPSAMNSLSVAAPNAPPASTSPASSAAVRSRTRSPMRTPIRAAPSPRRKTPYGRFCSPYGEPSAPVDPGHDLLASFMPAALCSQPASRRSSRSAGSVMLHAAEADPERTRPRPSGRGGGADQRGRRLGVPGRQQLGRSPRWSHRRRRRATAASTLTKPWWVKPVSGSVCRMAWCSPAVSLNGSRGPGRRRSPRPARAGRGEELGGEAAGAELGRDGQAVGARRGERVQRARQPDRSAASRRTPIDGAADRPSAAAAARRGRAAGPRRGGRPRPRAAGSAGAGRRRRAAAARPPTGRRR